jgi:hypothetical protein
MRVQLNTDRHIAAHDELAHQIETVMEGTVGRFADQITRVEVHLSDENSQKGGGDDNAACWRPVSRASSPWP